MNGQTGSIATTGGTDTDTSESLFKRADATMYRAKNSGRNRMFCDPGETRDAVLQEAVAEVC